MNSTIFAVGDKPYCLWEEDVEERTRDFLGGFDTEFYSYLLDCYGEPKDEKAEKRASVATRLALHHATETMFSLLGAFVQAPLCPYAWIARCSTEELRQVVRRIGIGDASLPTQWAGPASGWGAVSGRVHRHFNIDRKPQIVAGFAKTWARMASDFLSGVVQDEYNAIKHGFRARSGGFRIEVGQEEKYGVPAPESAMKTLGHSKFGSMFYRVEHHKERGGRHLTSCRTSVNWSVDRDTLLLELAQFTINNVVATLKLENGVKEECIAHFPSEDEDFDKPWTYSTGVISMRLDSTVDPSKLPEMTKEEILARLRKGKASPV